MKLHRAIAEAYQTLTEQAHNTRLILLHPQSRYRSVLVAHLLNDPSCRAYYHASGPDDINLDAFIAGILHSMGAQHSTFGRHTMKLLPGAGSDINALLDAFTRDLSELSTEYFFLILDEYDRTDSADDIQYFIERLSLRLPDHCRIIINSRTLPRLPWVAMIAHGRALILQDQAVVRRDFYHVRGGKQHLEVYALGPGFVIFNDQAIDTWEGHLPRLLFFFALDRPVVTRSEICQTFWPDLDDDQAVNVFHVTKRRLHKALEMDVLVHVDGCYQVNPELDVHYDVMNFAGYLMEGRRTDNEAPMQSWQHAIDTYRGPFLQGHQDTWIVNRRRDFQTGYLEALMSMAQMRMREERFEHALGLYQRALSEDGLRQDLHQHIMELYAHLGRRSEAVAHFKRLQEKAARDGHTISPLIEQTYQEILAK